MAAKLIPAAVLAECIALNVDQVQAAMEHGGAFVKLHTAKFQGMMPGGAFVYECTGEYFLPEYLHPEIPGNYEKELIPQPEFPDYLTNFKIKLSHEKTPLKDYKPESQQMVKRRMLPGNWIICWGA